MYYQRKIIDKKHKEEEKYKKLGIYELGDCKSLRGYSGNNTLGKEEAEGVPVVQVVK